MVATTFISSQVSTMNFEKWCFGCQYVNFTMKIMARKLTVLAVSSTGMIGFKIVTALLNKGATNVKAMVREL